MNLVYRYIMSRTKEPYHRGVRYLLLKNIDEQPVYFNHVQISPGDYFIASEKEVHESLDFIFCDVKVVKVKTIDDS